MKKKRGCLYTPSIRMTVAWSKALRCTLILGTLLGGAQEVFSIEQTRVTLTKRQVTLKEILEEYQRLSNKLIVYSDDKITSDVLMDINVSNADLETFMSKALAGTGMTYRVKDNYVLIIPEEKQNQVPRKVTSQSSEKREIRGKVLDQDKMPIPGVSVVVTGTTVGTSTDIDGNFVLLVDADAKTMTFSFVGMKSSILKIEKEMSVVLSAEDQELDEVVVVGYGVQKKVNLTGSVGSVGMDDVLKNRPVGDVGTALQGSMPGLDVQLSSTQPGASPSFNIRGFTSINGGAPLILVDNVPMDLAMVDPADIENVSILKDAASAAIYGARAAYGVILVTTKKGKTGDKLKVSYSNNFAFSTPYNLPVKASAREEIYAYQATGQEVSNRLGCDLETWLGFLDAFEADPSKFPGGVTYDENGGLYPLKENDLIALMMDDFGFQQKHNVSIQGSSGKNIYRLSLGLLHEDGILYTDKDKYKRYNLSAYWKTDIAKWLDVEADIKFADSYSSHVVDGIRNGIYGNAITLPSTTVVDPGVVDGVTYLPEISRSCLILSDPLYEKNKNLRMLGRFNLKPVKDLVITGECSYLFENEEIDDFRNQFFYQSLNTSLQENRAVSTFTKKKSPSLNHTLNLFGTYTKDIGNHEIVLMGGYNQENKESESLEVKRNDVISADNPSLSQSTGVVETKDFYSEFSTRSLFYRINYSFKRKYLIETNGRYDGSSKFPKSSRFGFFPSVSVAWRLSEEPFMQALNKVLSNTKLRGSIGTIGNQAIANYAFIPTMDAYLSDWLIGGNQITSLKPPAIVSNGFTWETVITYNTGVDFTLFNKLGITFDWYIRDTRDMLTQGMELPSALGTGAPKENAADLRTKGWELDLKWRDRIGEFGYNLGFNLYDSRTHITRFDNTVGLLSTRYEGQEIGDIWGYETAGLYQAHHFNEEGKLLSEYAKVEGFNPNPGDILYVDQDGDGVIDEGNKTLSDSGDKVIIGNDQRRYQYAINGGFNYKGIDFSFLLNGVGKRDIWQSNEMIFPLYTPFSTVMDHQLDYWTPENTNAYHARMYDGVEGNTEANRYCQSRYLLDGAYLKIKNVSLGYTLPSRWCKSMKMSNVSLFISGENLYTFYRTPQGINPESTNPEKGWSYPEMRKISFGLNLTL